MRSFIAFAARCFFAPLFVSLGLLTALWFGAEYKSWRAMPEQVDNTLPAELVAQIEHHLEAR